MFSSKMALTLFSYITIALALASATQANLDTQHRRDHGSLQRMLRKRAPQQDLGGLFPTTPTSASAAPAGTATTSDTAAAGASTAAAGTDTTSATASATSAASASSASNAASASSSASASASSAASSSASSVSASSASSATSASTTAPPTSTKAAVTTETAQAPAIEPVTVVSTSSLSAATPSSSSNQQNALASTSSKSTTYTVLIVVASCIAGTAIIWTIIRKWKFRPSSNFEDRMQPIDWQPTTGSDESGIPGHRRMGSGASSFHSGQSHGENGAGRGVGGYGATGHNNAILPDLPDHDFTAGSGLAPIGGYADLARGSSPQPEMQETLSRGPSVNRYDQYGQQAHHDPYAYNGGPTY